MKTATNDQVKDFAIRGLNLNKAKLDGEAYERGTKGFSNDEVEARIIAFWNNGLSFAMKGPGTLIVNRTKPFDLMPIWRGPKDDNGLEGEEDQDARSLRLTEVDFAEVLFTACLKKDEAVITGEEKLARHIAAKHIRLDAKVGQCLLEEKGQATLEWLYRTFGITWFELPGTVLRRAYGHRYFLYLCRDVLGRCLWRFFWLSLSGRLASVCGARKLALGS